MFEKLINMQRDGLILGFGGQADHGSMEAETANKAAKEKPALTVFRNEGENKCLSLAQVEELKKNIYMDKHRSTEHLSSIGDFPSAP